MKNLNLIVLFFFTISCGYPDIDNVPDFKNILIKNIDKCINDYKMNN